MHRRKIFTGERIEKQPTNFENIDVDADRRKLYPSFKQMTIHFMT